MLRRRLSHINSARGHVENELTHAHVLHTSGNWPTCSHTNTPGGSRGARVGPLDTHRLFLTLYIAKLIIYTLEFSTFSTQQQLRSQRDSVTYAASVMINLFLPFFLIIEAASGGRDSPILR